MKLKSYIALITPFTAHNEVDYEALRLIVEKLILEGVDGFIVNGTTAESPTLTENEKLTILEKVIEWNQNRVEIYFGIGSNNTCECMNYIKKTENMDFKGYLVVTPYYNLPSQYGMYEHYATLASETKKEIMLYNVPKRCGVSLEAETIIKLAHDYKNITGLKQASKDMQCVDEVLANTSDFEIYCGDDNYLLESLTHRMNGIISVIGHVYLKQINECLRKYEKGEDITLLDSLLKRLSSFIFLETSPIGIKALLSLQDQCKPLVRLPLSGISDENYEILKKGLELTIL